MTHDPSANPLSASTRTPRAFRFRIPATLVLLFAALATPACIAGSGDVDSEDDGSGYDAISGSSAVSRAEEWATAKLHYCQSPNQSATTTRPAPSTASARTTPPGTRTAATVRASSRGRGASRRRAGHHRVRAVRGRRDQRDLGLVAPTRRRREQRQSHHALQELGACRAPRRPASRSPAAAARRRTRTRSPRPSRSAAGRSTSVTTA